MAKKTDARDVTPIDLNSDSALHIDDSVDAMIAEHQNGVWLSVREATEYTGKKRMQITKAVNSGKLVARTRVIHPEYAPLTEINKADLDVWNTPKAPKVKAEHAGARATRGGQDRRWLLYVPDSQIEAVKAALAPFGLTPTTAYRNKKARDAENAASAEPNAETQAANADFSVFRDEALDTIAQIDTPIDLSLPGEQDASAPASTSDELELVEA